jgi:hypothetical protein
MSNISQFLMLGGGLTPRQQVFTASGTFTPSNRLLQLGGWVHVLLVGGGGGGYVDNDPNGPRYGGGGGEVISRVVQVTGAVSVTIGAGGMGRSNTPTAGGNSTFGSLLTARGGGVDGHSGNGNPRISYGGGGAGGSSTCRISGGAQTAIEGGGPGIDGYGFGGSGSPVGVGNPVDAPPNTGGGGYNGGHGGSGICIVTWWE